jgi:Domain of unknown function (DUF4258)
MVSSRFRRPVVITRHARQRMLERQIDDALLMRMIEEGGIRYRDAAHLWIWLEVAGRLDNVLCAAVVLDDALVVKTVMHRWELMP